MISVYTDGGYVFDFPDGRLLQDNKDFAIIEYDNALRAVTFWKSRSIVGISVSGALGGGVPPVVRP